MIYTEHVICKGFHPDSAGDVSIFVGSEEVKGNWVYGFYYRKDGKHYIAAPKHTCEVIEATVCRSSGEFDKTPWEEVSSNTKNVLADYDVSECNWRGHLLFVDDVLTDPSQRVSAEVTFHNGCFWAYIEETPESLEYETPSIHCYQMPLYQAINMMDLKVYTNLYEERGV